jgi:hypothetical protein
LISEPKKTSKGKENEQEQTAREEFSRARDEPISQITPSKN